MEKNELADFFRNDRVRYVPVQAKGDREHPDCADGKVTHIKGEYVFVRFDEMQGKPMKGKTLETPLAISPENLIHLKTEPESKAQPKQKSIKERIMALPDLVKTIIVTDNDSLERANKAKIYCKTMRKEIKNKMDPIRTAANKAHKAAIDLEKELLSPVIESEYYIDGQIGSYMTELRLIREAAERAERERKEEAEKETERKFQEALAAENAGEQEKAIEIIEEPVEPPPRIYVPPKRKIEGVHMRKNYDVWVDDISLLPDEYIIKTADLLKIKAFAMKHPGTPEMPGVKFVRKDIVI